MYTIVQPDKTTQYMKQVANSSNKVTIFLAGTIEMGAGIKWHRQVAEQIYHVLSAKIKDNAKMPELEFYNPRRTKDFTPEMETPQIKWEQEHLASADYIFMYIQPDSKSPISLLEFGEFIKSGKLYVYCEPTFYRYSNLALTAAFNQQADHVLNTTTSAINKLCDAIASKVSE